MAERKAIRGIAAGLALLFVTVAPAGAAQPSRRAAADFADFLELLAGRFDTRAQSRAEGEADGPRREAVQRVVVPVRAGFIGDTVYSLQETVAGDSRRVIGQQLLLLAMAQGAPAIVETPIAFNEPLRWRDGDRNPELFRSILPQDVKALAGCEVVWRRVAGGFDGATDPARCRSSAGGGGTLRVERRYTLRAEGFSLQERRFDDSGRLVAEEPTLQYQRRAP